VGMTVDDARATLKEHHFKMRQLDAADLLDCASKVPSGNVAFYGPKIAPRGATITVCPSSGTGQSIWSPPPPPKPTPHSSSPHPGSSGSSGGSGGSSTPPP